MPFKIVKASRSDDAPPYAGITCERAGVEAGKVYDDYAKAIIDSARLACFNPVGFRVVELDNRANIE